MNFLPEKKYGVPSHNFVKKNVSWEIGDEITRFDGNLLLTPLRSTLKNVLYKKKDIYKRSFANVLCMLLN
jgi:hypothetical protein